MVSEVERIILENLSSQNETLNLSAMGLNEIPRSVFQLTHLKELKLMHNKIKTIPKEISNLKNVTHIYLYNNKIKELPISSLKKMYSLQLIDLAENFVNYGVLDKVYKEVRKNSGYSEFMKELKLLKPDSTYFSFYGRINKIPKELFEFKHLEHLSIHGQSIKEIPAEICNLNKLSDLSLSGNKLKRLPKELFNIDSLRYLDLDSNKFKKFPSKLLDMPNLKNISFNRNKISYIKKFIDKVVLDETYKYFSFGDNPLKDFNSDLFMGGHEYIREFIYGVEVES